MGLALAEAARDRGARTTLVTGPVSIADPYGVESVHVETASQMRDAILEQVVDADALVMAAAVADYQPPEALGQKIKRKDRDGLDLSLVRTPDILAEVGTRPGLIKVAFAAESHDVVEYARQKIASKGVDLIAANDITAAGAGFGTETNRVTIIDRSGAEEELPLLSKYDVAWRILDRVVALLGRPTT
jgi:phosphopantothenoylcysteine decarboxylase/phosphopantothenate--cysteine ligase